MNPCMGLQAVPRVRWSKKLWKVFALISLGNPISSAEIVSEREKMKETGKVLLMARTRHGKL